MSYGFKTIVTGDYACFSRPEMKVERVRYDVPTPSALEGLIKSVYWKPAVRYQINKIVVFNPIEFTISETANERRRRSGDVHLGDTKSACGNGVEKCEIRYRVHV